MVHDSAISCLVSKRRYSHEEYVNLDLVQEAKNDNRFFADSPRIQISLHDVDSLRKAVILIGVSRDANYRKNNQIPE